MRYLLTVTAAAAALAIATPAFAEGEGFHGAGGCGFSAARLARLTTPKPVEPAQPTTAEVDQVLTLPQVAALLPVQPQPAAKR